jgi:acyl carrier protein
MGPLLVIPYEHPGFRLKLIDFQGISGKRLIEKLMQETASSGDDKVVAYRGATRLVQHYEPIPHVDLVTDIGPDAEKQEDDKQVILYVSPSGDTSLQQFLKSIRNAVILHAKGNDWQEIGQAVSDAAGIKGRIDAVIYEPELEPMGMKTLMEMSKGEEPHHWDVESFRHLNTCLSTCGADLGYGWLLSSLASVVGGYGLCELSAGASVYDAAAQGLSSPALSWMPINRDFIRKGAYPVTGITEEEAAAVYKQLWRLRDRLSWAVISAVPLDDRTLLPGQKRETERPRSTPPFMNTVGFKERPIHLGICALPNTEAEKVLCELAAEQLGVHPVGLEDHFYDLGGHSLLLTRLLSRIKDVFRVDLPLSTMLETPTVSGVISGLEKEWGSRDVLEEIAVSYRDYQKLVYEEMK